MFCAEIVLLAEETISLMQEVCSHVLFSVISEGILRYAKYKPGENIFGKQRNTRKKVGKY